MEGVATLQRRQDGEWVPYYLLPNGPTSVAASRGGRVDDDESLESIQGTYGVELAPGVSSRVRIPPVRSGEYKVVVVAFRDAESAGTPVVDQLTVR